MKLIDLYFDSTSVILASRVKRSGVHLVLSGGSLVSCGMCYLVCFALSDKKRKFFLALAAGIHISSAIFCVFLLSEDWILSTWTEKCLWTQNWGCRVPLWPFLHKVWNTHFKHDPCVKKCTLTRAKEPWAHCYPRAGSCALCRGSAWSPGWESHGLLWDGAVSPLLSKGPVKVVGSSSAFLCPSCSIPHGFADASCWLQAHLQKAGREHHCAFIWAPANSSAPGVPQESRWQQSLVLWIAGLFYKEPIWFCWELE